MSDAYNIEPAAPGGGALVKGLDSPVASAALGGAGRRISANSFKLLTARLKKQPDPDLAAAEPVHVPEAEVAPPPAPVDEIPPILVEVSAVIEQSPPQSAALPQFQPIDFYVPKQEIEEFDPPAAAPEPAALDETELEASVEPEPEALPEFILEPAGFVEPEAGTLEVPPAELQMEPQHLLSGADLEEPPDAAPEIGELPETVEPQIYEDIAIAAEETPEPVVSIAEQKAADPEPVHEEAKAQPSELAGRVVDAMIKTISTAVYAKPTASERAAFLREMAEIMEQEAAANGEPAPIAPEAAITAVQQPTPIEPPEAAPIADALASRIGPAAALLKPKAGQGEDPFAQNLTLSRLVDPKPAETVDADEESGELAITLLDMMSGGSGTALPHERTLAADTLLRILPRIPVKQLLAVVERVAIMETPPALLVAKLIRDSRHEVVAPLLERCSHISDQDLMNAAPDGDAPKLRMIARRRILSTVLSDYLISIGEPGVLLTLIRNPGAAFSHAAFFRLAEHATQHHSLLAPLATRADLPPPVAFELFWHVPQELRRFIFSRFLTDSENLNKILRITLATHADAANDVVGEGKFPSREAMESAVEQAANFRLDEAARQFAEIGSIAKDTALRILSDREGEPITVLFKALGYPRSKFEDVLARLRHSDSGILRPDRNPEEMQAIFDGLSFNKARILLTYWDWFVRKAGPYSPHN